MYLVGHLQHPTGYSFTFVDNTKDTIEVEFTRYGMACSCSKYTDSLPCAHCEFIAIRVFKTFTMVDAMKKHQGSFSIFAFANNSRQLYKDAFDKGANTDTESTDASDSEDEQSSDDELYHPRKRHQRADFSSDECKICFKPFSNDGSDCWVCPKEGYEVHEMCNDVKDRVYDIIY